MSIHTRPWFVYGTLLVALTASSTVVLVRAARLPETASVSPAHPDLNAPRLFRTHCSSCHDSGRTRIEFDGEPTLQSVQQAPALWKRIIRALRTEQMPPDVAVHAADRQRMLAWIEESLATMSEARVAARRLSTLE